MPHSVTTWSEVSQGHCSGRCQGETLLLYLAEETEDSEVVVISLATLLAVICFFCIFALKAPLEYYRLELYFCINSVYLHGK